jgi:uncharacterized RDD family membrane protein YckC
MSDAWYVAESDGTTYGPMSRDEVVRAAGRGEFAADALAWHVDLGEWLPLARILLRFGRTTQEAPSAAQVAKAQRREDRSKQRELPPSQRTDAAPKTTAEERKRRVATSTKPSRPPPLAAGADAQKAEAAAASARILALIGKRMLARYVDVMSLGLFGAAAWWSATEGRGPEADLAPNFWMLLWMACALWFVAESVLIGVFGTTPGKHLLGLRVCTPDGAAPGLARALRRSFSVYSRGMAFGLFVLMPFAVALAGVQTLNAKQAPWDQGLEVRAEAVASRWQLIAFVVVLLWIAAAEHWWLQLAATLVG